MKFYSIDYKSAWQFFLILSMSDLLSMLHTRLKLKVI